MAPSGYALMCCFVVAGIIGLTCLLKIPMFSINYSGTLKLSPKRLSPVRSRMILQILISSIPYFILNCSDEVLLILATVLIRIRVTDHAQQMIGYCQLIVFSIFHNIVRAFTRGFADCFSYIAGYNLGVKKISRIFEVLWFTLAVGFGTIVVIGGIIMIAFKQVIGIILPLNSDDHFLIREI